MLGSQKDNKEEELQITSKDLLEQITILYREKKYNIVENLAKKYLEKKPNDEDVRIVFAKTLHDMQRIFDAIEQAKIILKHKPHNIDIKVFLANCYVEVDKPTKAIAVLQEVLNVDPNNVVAIKELTRIYLKTNQKLSAIKMFKRLEEFLDSDQEKVKNKAIVAEIHTGFNEFDLAIKEYNDILQIHPDDINAKKNLIQLYQLTSNYITVVDLATEMLKTADPADVLWLLKMLMNTYRAMQDYEKALYYANLIEEHPLADKIQAGENIAQIFYEEGQYNTSIELLEALIARDPQNIALKKSLAKAYEANKDFFSAIGLYNNILEIVQPYDIAEIHYEMSNIYVDWAMYSFSQNDNDECFKHFMVAINYDPSNPDIYYRLGNVNKVIKNFNEAISQYKRAIDLDPKNPEYYFSIAECYEEIDSLYEQKKALIDYLKYDLNNPVVYYKLSHIYNVQNDTTSAMSHIKKAIELNPNFIEPKYKLALMYEHAGNKEGAIDLYEQILRLSPENEEAANNLRMLKS